MASSRYSIDKSKYLLDSEYEKLLYLLKTYIDSDKRNCLLLTIALNTGARATELLRLRQQDLDPESQTLFFRGIKGSNNREIPVHNWVYRKIEEYLEERTTPNELLFPISYNRLRQVWQHYRPTPKKFHSLRHTFAIRLYKKTKDIRLLQVALGHRNITNTMVYADYIYTQQELKKLIL